jgi:signal transduction histidine kinase/ActR/RegA family two-component response regulator
VPVIPLRRRLFLLAAAAILPLAVAAWGGLYALARQQRAQAQSVGLELARSVATGVDAELRSSILVLEALATTPTLDVDDVPGLLLRAGRVLAQEPNWVAITLASPEGRVVADTRVPAGVAPPPVADEQSFRRVVRSGQPVVGDLASHPQGTWRFAVRVPVVRRGELRYVLSALVDPEKVRGIVARQRTPPDWVISIVDSQGRRVARSRAHEVNLGGRLSESVAAVVAGGTDEGVGIAYTLEGERIFSPYSRLPGGWTAVLGIPTALVEAAVVRSLAVYAGGVLLSIVLGTLAAVWVARSINRPIGDLRDAAEALGRGERPRGPSTSIQEIREVASALTRTAERLETAGIERNDLLEKERAAREAAESADRAKEEFLAVLSHELRTPLNAVYGWARLLQSGEVRDPGVVARAMDAIVRNSDVQVQLIDDLLDLSRITSGKMRLELRAVDMRHVVEGALDAVRPAAAVKGVRLEAVVESAAGPVVGDAARLQQVVWNLLMNAVKFTPTGGRVDLRLGRAGSRVEIVVSDTGQGIAPDVLPHVFERFRQADSSSTRKHGGLGLGLALVKHLLELHGGDVVAQSEGEGRGATFVARLPVAAADAAATSPVRQLAGAPEGAVLPAAAVRLDGVRVLVTDDDGDASRLAEEILSRAGADVRTCVGAADALELLRRWRPDVLVSDIEMPGEDGYSLIRSVRALAAEEGGTTPAIALTAYGRALDRKRALAAGYRMHVPKPVDPGELTAIVASVVPDHSRAR